MAERVVISRHASNRLRLHKIPASLVAETVQQPEYVQPSYGGATRSWRRFRFGWLVVVHIREGDTIVVPTILYSKKGPRL